MKTVEVARRFWNGALLPLKAARFLFRTRGVKRVAILPMIVNGVLYIALLVWVVHTLWHWEWGTLAWTFWGGVGPALAAFLNRVVDIFKWVFLIPIVVLAGYYTFTVMGLVISFPLNAMLSERVELAACKGMERPAVTWQMMLRGWMYSFVDSLWLAGRQVAVALLLIPFLLIPIVGEMPLLGWGAYCMGVAFFDIPMGRNLLRDRHKKPMFRACRWEVFGFGLMMMLLFMVPLAGLLVLPLGVTAGTLLYCRCDWESVLRKSELEPPEGFTAPRCSV